MLCWLHIDSLHRQSGDCILVSELLADNIKSGHGIRTVEITTVVSLGNIFDYYRPEWNQQLLISAECLITGNHYY